jgi:hypothetical protein
MANLVQAIADQCNAHLEGVAYIKNNYLMTGRKPPTTASAYVSRVLEPLKQALNQQGLSESLGQEVCVAITTHFITAVKRLLAQVQKTEQSLERLRQLSGVSETRPLHGMTDCDKVRLQVSVDVREFKQQIEALGIPLFDAMHELESTAN